FIQAEDGIRVFHVTGVQTCALPICRLLDENVAQAEVGLRLKVSRQSVSRWADQSRRELAKVKRQGRPSGFDESARTKLRAALLRSEGRRVGEGSSGSGAGGRVYRIR